MKILMVANADKGHKRYSLGNVTLLAKAQVENTLECGWKPGDIVIISNFDFGFMGVEAIRAPLNDFCLTGSKMFGVHHWFFEMGMRETIWAKDMDLWANVHFDEPEFKDVGISRYSKDIYNGGSVFWKWEGRDIANEIVSAMDSGKAKKEEPVLNRMLRSGLFRDRVTTLNETYNLGCSGFLVRYERAEKPIRGCHFHPYNTIAWSTFALDRNQEGFVPITIRLERLFRRYWPSLATRMDPETIEIKKLQKAERDLKLKKKEKNRIEILDETDTGMIPASIKEYNESLLDDPDFADNEPFTRHG